MKTLLQVAQKLGDLTTKAAPKKTGNLKRELKATNTGRNILSGNNSAQAEQAIVEDLKTGTFSFQFNVDIAPDGAEYGQFWNDPTVSETVKKGKTKNIPGGINFGAKAYESAEFQAALDVYVGMLTDKIAASIEKEIDKELL